MPQIANSKVAPKYAYTTVALIAAGSESSAFDSAPASTVEKTGGETLSAMVSENSAAFEAVEAGIPALDTTTQNDVTFDSFWDT